MLQDFKDTFFIGELWLTVFKYIYILQTASCFVLLNTAIVWKICGNLIMENKINLSFYSEVKSWKRVLSTGLERMGIKKLIYKVVMFPVFFVPYTNKRSTLKYYAHYNFGCV